MTEKEHYPKAYLIPGVMEVIDFRKKKPPLVEGVIVYEIINPQEPVV